MTWDEVGYAVLLGCIILPAITIVVFDAVYFFRGPRSPFRRKGS